jgi:hypothetical protein
LISRTFSRVLSEFIIVVVVQACDLHNSRSISLLSDGMQTRGIQRRVYQINLTCAKKSGTFQSIHHHRTPLIHPPIVSPMSSIPTPEDPPAYLAQAKFSQKIVCRRTNSAVSFADIGDEGGVPLLWMMPSGGSRWFAVAHGTSFSSSHIRSMLV